jgi:hypothetical protein
MSYDADDNLIASIDALGFATTFKHCGSRNQKRNGKGVPIRENVFCKEEPSSKRTPWHPLQPIIRFAPSTKTPFRAFYLVSTA